MFCREKKYSLGCVLAKCIVWLLNVAWRREKVRTFLFKTLKSSQYADYHCSDRHKKQPQRFHAITSAGCHSGGIELLQIGMRPDFHLNKTIPSSICVQDFNRILAFGETNFGIFTLSNLHNNLFSESQCQNNYSFYLWLGETFAYFGHEGISTRSDFSFGSLLTLLFTNFIFFFHQNSKKVNFGEFVWFYLQTGPMFSELCASNRILSLDQINFHEIRWLYGCASRKVGLERKKVTWISPINQSKKSPSL